MLSLDWSLFKTILPNYPGCFGVACWTNSCFANWSHHPKFWKMLLRRIIGFVELGASVEFLAASLLPLKLDVDKPDNLPVFVCINRWNKTNSKPAKTETEREIHKIWKHTELKEVFRSFREFAKSSWMTQYTMCDRQNYYCSPFASRRSAFDMLSFSGGIPIKFRTAPYFEISQASSLQLWAKVDHQSVFHRNLVRSNTVLLPLHTKPVLLAGVQYVGHSGAGYVILLHSEYRWFIREKKYGFRPSSRDPICGRGVRIKQRGDVLGGGSKVRAGFAVAKLDW